MIKGISIIVPFVNENKEVLLTIESIEKYSSKINYEIILINDASDDSFNYKEIVKTRKNVSYYENKTRIGVAACRDMGVTLCKYDVFLLLDAHMRFYTDETLYRFLEVLSKERKILLCCHTKNIGLDIHENTPYGAYIELWGDKGGLYPIWNMKDIESGSLVSIVPCILGAAYAMHKSYWIYLRGLEGLQSYGSDEAYISMKVWLSGGKCLILKDIVVGHLYRKKAPYPFMGIDYVYNKIWVSLLILPIDIAFRVLHNLKQSFSLPFDLALCSLCKNMYHFIVLKEYYKKILVHPFECFHNLNWECEKFTSQKKDDEINSWLQAEQFLSEIISDKYDNQSWGLYDGEMGVVIFLYLYSRKVNDLSIEALAEKKMAGIIDHIENVNDVTLSFEKGLLGIAWGISFLVQEGFLNGNINDLLFDFDEILFNSIDKNFTDWSFDRGMMGLIFYSIMRMQQDNAIINRFPVFFVLLTKTIKHRYMNESTNWRETGFPIIVFLYLCLIENRYNMIENVVSFTCLKYLPEISNESRISYAESVLINNINNLLNDECL